MKKIILTILFVLNSSLGYCAIEDFSNTAIWVETDPSSDIAIVGSNSINVTSMGRNIDGGVTRDLGASAIGDFNYTFTFKIISNTGADFDQYPMVSVSNLATPTENDMDVANSGLAFNFFDDTAAPRYFGRVKDYDDNAASGYNFASDAFGILYDVVFYRVGTDLTAEISSGGSLLATVSLAAGTAASTAFQYVSAADGDEEGTSSTSLTFYVKDLDLQLTQAPSIIQGATLQGAVIN